MKEAIGPALRSGGKRPFDRGIGEEGRDNRDCSFLVNVGENRLQDYFSLTAALTPEIVAGCPLQAGRR